MRVAPALLVLAGCASADTTFMYTWDDRTLLCSASIDDYVAPPSWERLAQRFDDAAANGWVTMLHAHEPVASVSLATLDRVLAMADERGLELLTFRDLDGAPRAGLALAFDDDQVKWWVQARDVLAAHHAHVTYFVTRWQTFGAEELTDIRLLESDGHDLEPHSVDHLKALEYVAAHGVDAYVTEQVLPSFDPLIAEGYAPTTYAYPFGERSDEIDAAILPHIARVRTTAGFCPY